MIDEEYYVSRKLRETPQVDLAAQILRDIDERHSQDASVRNAPPPAVKFIEVTTSDVEKAHAAHARRQRTLPHVKRTHNGHPFGRSRCASVKPR